MKLSIKAGATSQSVNVFIRDSSSTTGGGLAAVAPAGGSLLSGTKLYYSFSGANASAGVAVSLSVLAAVNSAWSSAGIVTIDGTNMVGWVRIDIPNAALASGNGRSVSFLLFGGTNMAPTPFEIELTGWDNQSTTDGGLSKLTSLTYTVANQVDVNVADWKGATAPAMTGDAFARLGAPAGASVSADVAAIKSDTGTILTDVNTGAGAIYTRLGAPAGASIAADIAALPTAASNATAVLTTAMTESYRANGATGTLAQIQYELLAHLGESSISGTTKTVHKLDHATSAATFTLDSATAPTSITRAT